MAGDQEEWLPIEYRGFYDVPRSFVVEFRGSVYLFDCPFDDASDEYESVYTVYRLSAASSPFERESWMAMSEHGTAVGTVSLPSVEFDPTRRASIRARVFDRLGVPDRSTKAPVLPTNAGK